MCSTSISGVWRLVMPHLQLSSRTCAARLDRAWLSRAVWLEASNLKAKASDLLFLNLGRPAPRAVRALVALDLRNTKLVGSHVVDGLISVVRNCAGLRYLNLSRTRLRDAGTREVLAALVFDPCTGDYRPHHGLRVLCLEECGLSGSVVPELLEAAGAVPLEDLLLAKNELGDTGAKALASMLRTPIGIRRTLTRLDLSYNRLTAWGLVALLDALGGNRSLQSLDAGGNEGIGEGLAEASSESAQEVAVGLASSKGLRELHLWRCGLSDTACHILFEAAPRHLELLNLAANPLSSALRECLVRRDAHDMTAIRV